MTLALRHAVRSDVGHVRNNNEDAGYASFRLVAVADGMGGMAAGEVASKVAIGRLAALDDSGIGPDPLGALQSAVLAANQDLRDFVAADRALEGMGTTVTALLAGTSTLALLHVGDSRCYLFRDGELCQLTVDHTFVQTLVDSGQISPDEAAVHPQRSLMTRALDGRSGVDLDLSVREATVGDRYLLCSDGLHGVVTDETIAVALALPEPEAAAERLVELALRGGGPDNVTVVVADVVDTTAPQLDEEVDDVVVAGAAAEGPEPVRAPATSAAARAALAAGQAHRARDVPTEPGPGRARRVVGVLALPLLALIVIAGVVAGAWIYIQHQYYVGVAGDRVAIYRGVSGTVGPVHLSSVTSLAMPVSSLMPAFQQRVRAGVGAKSLGQAQEIVTELRADEIAPPPPPHPAPVTRPKPRTTRTAAAAS